MSCENWHSNAGKKLKWVFNRRDNLIRTERSPRMREIWVRAFVATGLSRINRKWQLHIQTLGKQVSRVLEDDHDKRPSRDTLGVAR